MKKIKSITSGYKNYRSYISLIRLKNNISLKKKKSIINLFQNENSPIIKAIDMFWDGMIWMTTNKVKVFHIINSRV